MTIIFKSKTHEGYIFKVLAELLQNNIKNACLKIDKNGISLCQMDNHRTILISFFLEAINFSIYKFKPSKPMLLGINLTHLYKMLKMIKKKDCIQLYIDDKNPTDLGIKVIPKENNRITTSFVKIQDIQNIDIDIPEGYSKPVIVPSVEFQKMAKDLSNISDTVNIYAKNFQIRFVCDAGGVMKRQVDFGENGDSDSDTSDEMEEDMKYQQDFKTEHFTKIMKIAGLSNNLQIFPKNNFPLLFKSQIGSLGKINIFVKSIQDIINENKAFENEGCVEL